MLLLPYFIFLAIFWLVPLIGGIKMSLFSDDLYGKTNFVGLKHYSALSIDGRYWKAFGNTFLVYNRGMMDLDDRNAGVKV